MFSIEAYVHKNNFKQAKFKPKNYYSPQLDNVLRCFEGVKSEKFSSSPNHGGRHFFSKILAPPLKMARRGPCIQKLRRDLNQFAVTEYSWFLFSAKELESRL